MSERSPAVDKTLGSVLGNISILLRYKSAELIPWKKGGGVGGVDGVGGGSGRGKKLRRSLSRSRNSFQMRRNQKTEEGARATGFYRPAYR